MSALSIVPDLNELKDIAGGFFTRAPIRVVDQLALERSEEAFGHGIVPTVPFAAHACCDAVRSEQRAVLLTRVLHPAIGVMKQAGFWLTPSQGHAQRAQHQGAI